MKFKKENKIVFYTLSLTWGLLWTLIGILVLAIIKIIYRKDVEITNCHGRIAIHFYEKNFGGVSFGLVIITSGPRQTESLTRHELGHTIQAALFGPLFILCVAIPSGIRYQYRMRTKRPLKTTYDSIWFERQATEFGDKYFR